MYVYMYTDIHIYIYILFIYREREIDIYIYIYMYIHAYISICKGLFGNSCIFLAQRETVGSAFGVRVEETPHR